MSRVLITAKSVAGSAAALRFLREAGCEVDVQVTPQPPDERWLIEQARTADALVFAMEPVSAALIDAAPRLQVIARPGVGYDTVDLAAANRRGIAITIAAGTNHQSVADFSFGLLLDAARGIGRAALGVQQGGWPRHTGTEVWGKTLAIVGLGRIGQAVAQRARGFEMRVLGVAGRSPVDAAIAERLGIEMTSFEQALSQADFVSLHAPLTDATRGLINARTLALMKPGAFLINTSRGGLIDEAALADAVKRGRLGGAAVDVLCSQGEGSTSPLLGVPGIVVTPHMASLAHEAVERVAMSVAHSVVAALRGERPPGLVNPERSPWPSPPN